jgi:hypothetical protein
MKGLLRSIVLAAAASVLPMAAHAGGALPQEESTTAPMPLDLALAKKLLLPEPLASVQKIIGTPGETNSTEGKVVSVRWWHDCGGDTMSFGDVFIRDGQVAHLWFQGCAGENIIRDADGDFYVLEANGTETYLTETAKERAFSEGQKQFVAKALGVPCAMMALDIEAIAEEHLGYPDESHDELVARYVAAALPNLRAAGQDISFETLTQRAGQLVDYVEDHSDSAPEQLKGQFTTACTSGKLPW